MPYARNSIKNQKNLGIEEYHTIFERTRYEKLKDLIGKRMWKFEESRRNDTEIQRIL